MQVYKAFMKVARKKSKSMLIYIVVFLAISVVYSLSDVSDTIFTDTQLKVCVYDDDDTPESRSLTDFVYSRHTCVDVARDHDHITDALYYGAISGTDCVFVINKGYSDALAEGRTDGLFTFYTMHDSYQETMMETQLGEYIRSVAAYTAAGEELSEAIAHTEEAVSKRTEVTLTAPDTGDSEYSQMFSVYFLYMAYILLAVMMNTLCPVLMTMNRREIRYRTNCSSIRPLSGSLQIFAGSVTLVLGIWLIFMAAGAVLNGGLYHGKALIAVLNSLVFSVVSASIALFVSCFSLNKNLLNLATQIISLGLSFLSGVFVEQSLLGDGVLAVARLFPAYWYVKANDMLSGLDGEIYDGAEVARCIMIQVAYALALFVLTLLIRRIRYSEASVATGRRREPVPQN